jgi:hypothetical protein
VWTTLRPATLRTVDHPLPAGRRGRRTRRGDPLRLEYGDERGTVFDSDDSRREAWEQRRESILADYIRPPYVGRRPWAFWRFDCGRDPRVIKDPGPWWRADDKDAYADELDRFHNEPIIYLARHDYLTDRELDAIEQRADEARPRIGTPAEHIGSGGIDRADRRRVKLADAVSAAASPSQRR